MAKLGFWSASCGTFIPSTAVTHICPTLSTLGKHFMQDCKYKNTNTNTNIQIQLHPFIIGQTFCAQQHKIVQNYGYHSHPSMIGYNCTKFIFWQKSMKHAPLLITPVPRQSILWRFRQNGLPMKLLLLIITHTSVFGVINLQSYSFDHFWEFYFGKGEFPRNQRQLDLSELVSSGK